MPKYTTRDKVRYTAEVAQRLQDIINVKGIAGIRDVYPDCNPYYIRDQFRKRGFSLEYSSEKRTKHRQAFMTTNKYPELTPLFRSQLQEAALSGRAAVLSLFPKGIAHENSIIHWVEHTAGIKVANTHAASFDYSMVSPDDLNQMQTDYYLMGKYSLLKYKPDGVSLSQFRDHYYRLGLLKAGPSARMYGYRKTCLELYGVDHAFKAKSIKLKIRACKLSKYLKPFGVDCIEQLSDWQRILGSDFCSFKETLAAAGQRLLGHPWAGLDWSLWGDDDSFLDHISDHRYKLLWSESQRSSRLEKLVCSMLGAHKERIKLGAKRWLELDCCFEKLKIAFELNGYPFHTSLYKPECCEGDAKPSDFHVRKTNLALSFGYKLYHIWYQDSYADAEQVLFFIKAKLGLFEREIDARKLVLVYPDHSAAINFYIKYHASGSPGSNFFLSVGLADRSTGELLTAMSFRMSQDKGIPELARYCTVYGVSIIKGFDRLMSHALIELKHRGFKTLLTYCDRDLSPVPEDTVYYRYGFKFIEDSGSSLWYWNNCISKVESRWKYQKHKLSRLFSDCPSGDFDIDQFLSQHDIYPCFNSGNFKFMFGIP